MHTRCPLARPPWTLGALLLLLSLGLEARAEEPDVEPRATPTTLGSLIDHLLAESPRIQSARARVRAAGEVVPQATRLPDLQISYSYLPMPVQTRVGPNEHRIGASQGIPFPTKLTAKKAKARAELELAGAQLAATVRDEVSKLKSGYAELFYLAHALRILEQHEAIAQALVQVGAERQASDRGSLVDVVRAQAQRAQLAYDRVSLTERRDAVRAKLNGTLGRPPTAELPTPRTLPSPLPAPDRERVLRAARAHRPELRAAMARVEIARAMVRSAHAGWLPDISVGAQLMVQGPAEMQPAPPDSGEEAFAITLGLNLPLALGSNLARNRQAGHRLDAAQRAHQAELDELPGALEAELVARSNADRLVRLYDAQLLPQAQAALGNAEQWQRDDVSRYSDALEARATLFSFELARARAAADRFEAEVRLEGLVGRPLKRPGVEP